MAIDLISNSSRKQAEDVAIVRVEMLYPFPEDELKKVLANYPSLREVVWVQEEPLNMGAWTYMSTRLAKMLESSNELNVIARTARSSPATGFSDLFQSEQEYIIGEALHASVKQVRR
jgi:2-oxoglutarate dehydrogenase E1 component